jgi:hypothetical protein
VPIFFVMAAGSLSARYYGTTIALVNTMGHVGAFSGPLVYGLVGSRSSGQAGLVALAVPAIIGGAAMCAVSVAWQRAEVGPGRDPPI